MATQSTSVIRTYLEQILNLTNSGDAFIGSTYELQIINIGYEKTAYRFDWPQTLKRYADVIVANVDRYATQSDLRKFRFLKVLNIDKDEVEIDDLPFSTDAYAVDAVSSEYILSEIPSTASTAYTFSASYSAGNSVAITLNSVAGIGAQDEIFISDGASSEFTKVQSVSSSATTITVKLKNAHSNKTLYRVSELVYFEYYTRITLLAAAADVTVLPDETDFIIPYYSAYLYYQKLEQKDRAKEMYDAWDNQIKDAWQAWDKTSTGAAGQFTLEFKSVTRP